ncbi:little elongation complex subunit 2 isoform X2 [Sceloporus undulatus]|uniref:little elongation complex subunit 2 isoform X2 n=1 Tax=Sceloporus undulatus TaxID=8520 RepID=UPI001C4B51FA|nr:little elongation complex subunit 2 isoform X2 [Sceloporus undulatus]
MPFVKQRRCFQRGRPKMAAAGKLLSWDIPPRNGHNVYFSRSMYEKYSLAPSLAELLELSKRPTDGNADLSNAGQKNRISSRKTAVKPAREPAKPSAEMPPFQDPRVPYPYFSSFTEKEQRRYLFLLSTYANAHPNMIDPSAQKDYSQYLQMKELVSKEVAEFLKFAQNAARSCNKDYENISEEALLYAKKFLTSRIGYVKKYPEFYTLCEITGIMGGKFNTELTLRFEKNLLALGKMNLIKRFFPKLPSSIQLPVRRSKTNLEIATPEQRAAGLHSDVSTDANAEKLAVKYCPQVVLTSESLYTLLNNHGLDYKQQWELPVSVKTLSGTDLKPVKVVYVDPPLPKKEVTVREKNQIFHEFLADFHMTKQSTVFAHAAILDKPSEKPSRTELETCRGREVQVADSADLHFDIDVTELETFASTSKFLNTSKPEGTRGKPTNIPKILSEHLKMEKEAAWDMNREGSTKAMEQRARSHSSGNFNNTLPLHGDVLGSDCNENSSVKRVKLMETKPDDERDKDSNTFSSSLGIKNNLKEGVDVVKDDSSAVLPCCSDADEESLIIDTECKNSSRVESGVIVSDQGPKLDIAPCSRGALPGKLDDSSEDREKNNPQNEPGIQGRREPQQETNAPRKPCRRLSKKFDPVGQILKMQTKLLKPPSLDRQGQPEANVERTLNPSPSQENPVLKVSASSTPAPEQSTAADPSSSPKGVLWNMPEDGSDYDPPDQGNLVYKLFSLDDLLLLVRSSVQKVELRPRSKKAQVKRHFPVYVLPKLEYQAFYGAEALTEGEVCRLWMEGLLHSNSSFAIGHIDALTSNLFLLEQLSAERLKRRFGTFKPANSLNILQHILKKVAGLQEGSYLLAHAAGDSFVSIYKSSQENATGVTYNLHAAHSDLPGAPSVLSVPWVPLDPNIPLSYHFAQGWVPCTFPPKQLDAARNEKASGDTPSRGEHLPMETNNNVPPAHPFQKRRGAAQNKAARRTIYRQANWGPNWKFWKEPKDEKT